MKLAGDLIVPEELARQIEVVPGMVYSQKDVAQSTTRITKRLGNEGYAFANVTTVPELDHDNRQVTLPFFVDPGKRVYVRRINFLAPQEMSVRSVEFNFSLQASRDVPSNLITFMYDPSTDSWTVGEVLPYKPEP